MSYDNPTSSFRISIVTAVVASMLAALSAIIPIATPAASAQAAVPFEVWGLDGGAVPDARTWMLRQSCDPALVLDQYEAPGSYPNGQVVCSAPIGTLDAATPAFPLDQNWRPYGPTTAPGPLAGEPVFDDVNTGPEVANHFVKTFTLQDVGVPYSSIEGIQFSVFYDDSAIVYLNGVEVYRSIRGNLPDPGTIRPGVVSAPGVLLDDADGNGIVDYPLNANIPYDVPVIHGGAENYYVEVPNYLGQNQCEIPVHCTLSPYIDPADAALPGTPEYSGKNPPAADRSILDTNGDGIVSSTDVHVWSVTVWNQDSSVDSSFDHTFDLIVDPTQFPTQQIAINEIVASNTNSWLVNTDTDAALESPDWIELHNFTNTSVNIGGWKLSDQTASYTIPAGTAIPANGYLLVAANDCVVGAGSSCTNPLQANFKLSSFGDQVRLIRNTGFIEDSVTFADQFPDNAFGRPLDNGPATYLQSFTPGATNSAAGNNYAPILRFFPDRLYNVGETVDHQLDAFDPDGDAISYGLTGIPGVAANTTLGQLTGSNAAPGVYNGTITATDVDGNDSQSVKWRVFDAVAGGSPFVLNEYNAVSSSDQLAVGGGPLGNGGDWFEFLVVEDDLDLRGWTIQLWDRANSLGQAELSSTITFANGTAFAAVPAGTLIVIGEQTTDDLGFDGVNDWTIHLQAAANGNGTYFTPNGALEVFNSTRRDQMVLITDASGAVRTPLSGETDGWDRVNGGVSSGEVMNLCVNPVATTEINPITQYRDNASISTPGAENQCRHYASNGTLQTFNQNLTALRNTATLSGQSLDVNCDGQLTVADVARTMELVVGLRSDTGHCGISGSGPFTASAMVADIDGSGQPTAVDASVLMQCVVLIPNPLC